MLNRALTLTGIAILFLLGLQAVWLFRLIEDEKNRFSDEIQKTLEESMRKELDWRLRNINKGKNFSLILSNSIPEQNFPDTNNLLNVDIKQSQELLTKVSLEEALQEIYKKDYPLNLDTFALYFTHALDELGKPASFILDYVSPDTLVSYNSPGSQKGLFLLKPSFTTELPITVSKDLVIKAEVFYPKSVFKGDLLVILLLSLALTIFILVAIVVQTRMLYKQVSLAKVKENITHFLTHELRSPLQSSITNLEVGEIADAQNSGYFLSKAKEQLYFLNSLIENILNINKFEKRQAPLSMAYFETEEAIEPHLVRHNINNTKKVTITSSCDPSCSRFFGDKLHITNAIGNLIDNAVKYSGDDVAIDVTVKPAGKFTAISVKDNGIGIPKEEQYKVFEKFYRIGKQEHAQKGKGFGLGLTYVQWVTKAHRGKVELISEAGVGSEFILYLKNSDHGTKDFTGRR